MAAQLRDQLQKLKEQLRTEVGDIMRPGPLLMDVHPDDPPIPDPSEIAASLDRTMKVSVQAMKWQCMHQTMPSGTLHANLHVLCASLCTSCLLLGLTASSLSSVFACCHQ